MLRLEPPNAVIKKANNENNLLPPCKPLLLTIPSPAELVSRENRALWKLIFRARKRDVKEVSVNVTQETSSEVIEIFAVRGFKVTFSSSFSYDCSYSILNNRELFRTNGITRPSL